MTRRFSFRLVFASAILAASTAISAFGASKPVRLYEVAATRFFNDAASKQWIERGLLDSKGQFNVTSTAEVLSTVVVPLPALNRVLITYESWLAYNNLGATAVANFVADPAGERFTVGAREYLSIAAAPDAKLDVGDAVNLSTRGTVAPGGDPLIGGVVIEDHERWVLIRGVGPTLAAFGVATPLSDPTIAVYAQGGAAPLLSNNDWSAGADTTLIETVSRQVSAFPLPRGSKDAVCLVKLQPGAYTVHLGVASGSGRTALLEIYLVP